LDKFYSDEYATVVLPGQMKVAYDPYLARFLQMCFEGRDPRMVKFRTFSVDGHWAYAIPSLWDAVAQRDYALLNDTFTKAALVGIGTFSDLTYARSIRFSGMTHVMYPVDPPDSVEFELGQGSKLISPMGVSISLYEGTWNETMLSHQTKLKAYHLSQPSATYTNMIFPTAVDTYYVLSENFYNETQMLSRLETLVTLYLKRQSINLVELSDLAKLSLSWPPLEKFYYIPLLVTLMDASILRR
jgi:hypothetical protein